MSLRCREEPAFGVCKQRLVRMHRLTVLLVVGLLASCVAGVTVEDRLAQATQLFQQGQYQEVIGKGRAAIHSADHCALGGPGNGVAPEVPDDDAARA
jgi:hypothetical protein